LIGGVHRAKVALILREPLAEMEPLFRHHRSKALPQLTLVSDILLLTFIAPSDAALVELVRRNLRLLAELRSTYLPARDETTRPGVRAPEDVVTMLAPEMELLTQEQLRVVLSPPWQDSNVSTPAACSASTIRTIPLSSADALILVCCLIPMDGAPSPAPSYLKPPPAIER
jgi:hypothetical protein